MTPTICYKVYDVSACCDTDYLGGQRKAPNVMSAKMQIASDFEDLYGKQPAEVEAKLATMKLYAVIAIGTNSSGSTKYEFGSVISDSELSAMKTIDACFQEKLGFVPQTVDVREVPEAMIAKVAQKPAQ
jgi:hypothetical protein